MNKHGRGLSQSTRQMSEQLPVRALRFEGKLSGRKMPDRIEATPKRELEPDTASGQVSE